MLAQNPTASQAAVAHQAAGVVLRHFGDIDEAIEEFKNARRFARKAGDLDRESDVLASLGVAWVLAGQTRRGLSVLDTLVQGSSGVPAGRILIRRAYAFWVLGRNAEALRDAQAAVDLLSGARRPGLGSACAAPPGNGVLSPWVIPSGPTRTTPGPRRCRHVRPAPGVRDTCARNAA